MSDQSTFCVPQRLSITASHVVGVLRLNHPGSLDPPAPSVARLLSEGANICISVGDRSVVQNLKQKPRFNPS